MSEEVKVRHRNQPWLRYCPSVAYIFLFACGQKYVATGQGTATGANDLISQPADTSLHHFYAYIKQDVAEGQASTDPTGEAKQTATLRARPTEFCATQQPTQGYWDFVIELENRKAGSTPASPDVLSLPVPGTYTLQSAPSTSQGLWFFPYIQWVEQSDSSASSQSEISFAVTSGTLTISQLDLINLTVTGAIDHWTGAIRGATTTLSPPLSTFTFASEAALVEKSDTCFEVFQD